MGAPTPVRHALAIVVVIAAATGCTRGAYPPRPTEDLTPTVVGIVAETTEVTPVALTNGQSFAPPPDAVIDVLDNWPGDDRVHEEGFFAGTLLLGGKRQDGSWWYEPALDEDPADPPCWAISGGAFDEGDSIRLSSGVRLQKSPDFDVRTDLGGPPPTDAFPGRPYDAVCINDQGEVAYFTVFTPR